MWLSKTVLVGVKNGGGNRRNSPRKSLDYDWRLKYAGRRVRSVGCSTRWCPGEVPIATGISSNREEKLIWELKCNDGIIHHVRHFKGSKGRMNR